MFPIILMPCRNFREQFENSQQHVGERTSLVSHSLSTTSVRFNLRQLVNVSFPNNLVNNSFSLSLSEKRFNKQYSKEYKAKEVSEGEESKDLWNVLGGKANFTSLSGGLYCWTIGCILFILRKFYARVMGFHESGNGQGKQYFSRSVKSQGICYFRYIKIRRNSEA